jgi:hypothetical protein
MTDEARVGPVCPDCRKIVSRTFGHDSGCPMPTRNDPPPVLPGRGPAEIRAELIAAGVLK